MTKLETVGDSRALQFLRKGEFYGACLLPQRDQVYALVDRLDRLAPTKHIPPEVVGFACGLSAITSMPITLVDHGPSFSAQEKSNILMTHQEDIAAQLGFSEVSVLPLKTITLRVGNEAVPTYVLLTRVGDYSLERGTKSDLSPVLKRLFQTERNPLGRGLIINPSEFDPRLKLGIEPGLVSPFVRANSTSYFLKGLLYYKDNSFDGFVAIAVSPIDTLIVHRTIFNSTLNWWQEHFLGIPFRSVVKSFRDSSVVNQ